MTRATLQLRNLAERLIAHEAKGHKSVVTRGPSEFYACEKLRPRLTSLMGNTGFRALLSRALVLSAAEVPWLRVVSVEADGSLQGLDELESRVTPAEIAKGQAVLLAQLLGLLVAFIGEDLTVGLAREVWPKLSLNGLDAGNRRSR